MGSEDSQAGGESGGGGRDNVVRFPGAWRGGTGEAAESDTPSRLASALTHEPESGSLLSADDFWSGASVMPEPVQERPAPGEQHPAPTNSGTPAPAGVGEPPRQPFADIGGEFIPIGASAEDDEAEVGAAAINGGGRSPTVRRLSGRRRFGAGVVRPRRWGAVAGVGVVCVVAVAVALGQLGRGTRSPVRTALAERHQIARPRTATADLAPLTPRELQQAAREAMARARGHSSHVRTAEARRPARHRRLPASVSAAAPVGQTGGSAPNTAPGGSTPTASTYAPVAYSQPPASGATSGVSASSASSQPAGPTSVGSAGANCDPKCS